MPCKSLWCGAGQEYDASPELAKKRRQAKRKPEKTMHQSLLESMAEKDSMSNLGHFHRTTALVGDRAEKSYKESRIVSNSAVMPTALRESPKKQREVFTFSDGTQHVTRQMCVFEACALLHSASHMARFYHQCRFGALCPQRKDRTHAQFYTHPDPDLSADAFSSKWEHENTVSPHCVPTLAAQRYQSHRPPYGYAPRGNFRPQLGYPEPPDLVDEHRRQRQIRLDKVALEVDGLDARWTDEDFACIVRDAVGTVPVRSAYLSMEGGNPTGQGIVEVGCFADARTVVRAMHMKAPEGYPAAVLSLSYIEQVADADGVDKRPSMAGAAGYGLKLLGKSEMVDPAVRRYSRAVRMCGAYWHDAEAVLARMKEEGHRPDAACVVHLMRSYAETDPPQAARAERAMVQMRGEGIPITASACNYVVKAWCRTGNMRKAELLVKEMEREKFPAYQYGPWRGEYMPLPNEETYHILCDAWKRLGIMSDIGERQRGFELDEDKCGVSVGGVVGSAHPAPSYVTAWARRRSGYMGPHNGNFVPRIDPDLNAGAMYVSRNWVERT